MQGDNRFEYNQYNFKRSENLLLVSLNILITFLGKSHDWNDVYFLL